MGILSTAPLFWLLACVSFGGAWASKRKKNETETKVPMPHHSFAPPMTYKDLLDVWTVSGASIFEKERLLLHPNVSERMGFLWSKLPVMTENFEIIVHFRVVGEKTPANFASDQSFSVWYIEQNVARDYDEKAMIKAKSWKEAMNEAGLTLGGSKAKFKGIGAVLSMGDAEKKQRPVVSYISNDGTKTLVYGPDVPTTNAKAVDFRNTLNAAQLKIRITPEYVEAHLKQSPSLSWNECFRINRTAGDVPVPSRGYIGVTAWSGTSPEEVSDLISVTQMEVNNFDDTSIGEEMKDVSAKIQEAYREMLTDENRHFIDQKSQMEHLKRLTGMLQDHVTEVGPADNKLFQDLQSLDVRVSRLDEDCRTLSKEFSILVNPTGHEGAGAVKKEIVGLRTLLTKDNMAHNSRIAAVSKNVKEVKEKRAGSPEALDVMAKQSEVLEKTVASRSSQMSGMLFCLIGCVVVIGVLIFNRMRYYEKKHFI